MTTFTKLANYLFRGSVIASVVTVTTAFSKEGTILQNALKVMDNPENLAAKIDTLNLNGLTSHIQMITVILLITSILSIVAFKCSGPVVSVLRSIVLFLLTGVSIMTTVMFTGADLLVRNVAGTISSEELAQIQPIIDVVSTEGATQSTLIGSLAMFGTVMTAAILVVLAVLLITSIISIVKTLRDN